MFSYSISKNKSCTFFDVGSNMGYFTLLSASMKADVHSFEPIPELYSMLETSVKTNGYDNIYLNNLCLSDNEDPKYLKTFERNMGGSRIDPEGTIKSESLTLDAYCQSHDVRLIDLIKIDVEGHEIHVLKGSVRMLSEFRIKNIIIEVTPKWGLKEALDIVNLLVKHGFILYNLGVMEHGFILKSNNHNNNREIHINDALNCIQTNILATYNDKILYPRIIF